MRSCYLGYDEFESEDDDEFESDEGDEYESDCESENFLDLDHLHRVYDAETPSSILERRRRQFLEQEQEQDRNGSTTKSKATMVVDYDVNSASHPSPSSETQSMLAGRSGCTVGRRGSEVGRGETESSLSSTAGVSLNGVEDYDVNSASRPSPSSETQSMLAGRSGCTVGRRGSEVGRGETESSLSSTASDSLNGDAESSCGGVLNMSSPSVDAYFNKKPKNKYRKRMRNMKKKAARRHREERIGDYLQIPAGARLSSSLPKLTLTTNFTPPSTANCTPKPKDLEESAFWRGVEDGAEFIHRNQLLALGIHQSPSQANTCMPDCLENILSAIMTKQKLEMLPLKDGGSGPDSSTSIAIADLGEYLRSELFSSDHSRRPTTADMEKVLSKVGFDFKHLNGKSKIDILTRTEGSFIIICELSNDFGEQSTHCVTYIARHRLLIENSPRQKPLRILDAGIKAITEGNVNIKSKLINKKLRRKIADQYFKMVVEGDMNVILSCYEISKND